MEIALQGFDRLQRGFDRAPDLVSREMRRWLETSLAHLTDDITALTPKDTGLLQKSIQPSDIQVGRLGVSGLVGTPLNYALPVEFGAKPHDITPKNGKALAFFMRGTPVFAKKVRHPGSKGYFMFSRAFQANQQQIQDSFTRMVDNVLAKIAAGAT